MCKIPIRLNIKISGFHKRPRSQTLPAEKNHNRGDDPILEVSIKFCPAFSTISTGEYMITRLS